MATVFTGRLTSKTTDNGNRTLLVLDESQAVEPAPMHIATAAEEYRQTHKGDGTLRKATAEEKAQARELRCRAEREHDNARKWLLERIGIVGPHALAETLDAMAWLLRHPTLHPYEGQFWSIARQTARKAARLAESASAPRIAKSAKRQSAEPEKAPSEWVRYRNDGMIRAGVQLGVLDQGSAAWMLQG